MSRTSNSLKNVKSAMLGQILALVVSFITRMVFVRILEAEYLGLNGLFSNIISMISFAELGIGTSITYSLYKPLAENDKNKINILMKIFKKTYILIGIIVLTLGTALTPFLNVIISDMPRLPNIQLIYMIFVMNSAISYFFSYKRSLIMADQKNYINTTYHYFFYFISNIFQIIILIYTNNYILYLLVQLISTILENVMISKRADKLYPFLREEATGKLETSEKNKIIKNIKAMIFHKIGSIAVNSTDSLIIAKFVNLVSVGIYNNYFLIVNALNIIFGQMFKSLTASVGNLGTTESEKKNRFIFNCIDLAGFWIFGFSSICLLFLFNPFITLWLGQNYLFSMKIVMVIVFNFYLTGMRQSVLTFRDALGLYWYDRYKPLFEALINLVVSIYLVNKFGVMGVFMGTAISTLTTCFWVEPYILFKHGFKAPVLSYFINYLRNTILLVVTVLITGLLCSIVPDNGTMGFFIKLIICIIVPNIIFIFRFREHEEFKFLKNIIKLRIHR